MENTNEAPAEPITFVTGDTNTLNPCDGEIL